MHGLLSEVRQPIVDFQALIDVFNAEGADIIFTNVAGRLGNFRPPLRSFLRRQKRSSTSHAFDQL